MPRFIIINCRTAPSDVFSIRQQIRQGSVLIGHRSVEINFSFAATVYLSPLARAAVQRENNDTLGNSFFGKSGAYQSI